MKLQEIADQMIMFARKQPYGGGDIRPYQSPLQRGLSLTYYIDQLGHHLSLTRQGVPPSTFEEDIVKKCFAVPADHASRDDVGQGPARIIRYEWADKPVLVKIRWPATTPEEAMPAGYRRLADGQLEAIYFSVEELQETVTVLALVREAHALASQPQPQLEQTEMFTRPVEYV